MTARWHARLLLPLLTTALAACASAPMWTATQALSQAEAAVSRTRESLDSPSSSVLLVEAEQKLQQARRLVTRDDPDEADFRRAERLAGQAARDAERARRLQAAAGEAPAADRQDVDPERRLAGMEPRRTEDGIVLTLGGTLFGFDSAELEPAAQDPLDRLAAFLRENRMRGIRIEGHTDNVGDEGYNQRLSEQRAAAVAEALESRGIDPARMNVVGYGETRPVSSNADPEGRRRNRRVEVVVLD